MVGACKERTSFALSDNILKPPLEKANYFQPYSEYISYYDNTLYLGIGNTPNRVQAVNAKTGNLIWSFDVPGTSGSMGMYPAINENFVFCAGQKSLNLYALDRNSGQQMV